MKRHFENPPPSIEDRDLIRLLEIELAQRRATRQMRGNGNHLVLRLASMLMLLGLSATVAGAMWYSQTLQAGVTRRLPAQALSTSAPGAGQDRQPAPMPH